MDTEAWLIRTPDGWTEPMPPQCGCGSTRFLIGWTHCLCGQGPLTGGHRTWTCRACEKRQAVGCTGHRGLGPMEEYGCR